MKPTISPELRIQLAAQREAAMTSAIICATMEAVKLTTSYPENVKDFLAVVKEFNEANTFDYHLKAIDNLIRCAEGARL